MPEMEVAESLLDLVGNTPMVRLRRVGADLACDLIAKGIVGSMPVAGRAASLNMNSGRGSSALA